jgi:ribosomal-protein-alanine N-acetyltransferase
MPGITQASLAHAELLATLHAQAFPHDPWDAASCATILTQPGMLTLIHPSGGFLLLRSILDEAEIITIGTTTPGQGIATGLLKAALKRSPQLTKIHLEVAEHNAAARALYAKFGFTQTGRRKAYYPDGSDALTFSLDLSQGL